jgi:hypothetical protein
MQEADMGITSMAMGGNNGRHQGDEHLLVRFYMHPAKDKTASAEAGRPIFKDVPYVHIMQPGNKESIIHRKATDMDINRFAEHYRKFEARENQEAMEGTPLVEWPGVTRSQAEELKFYNVITVEQLVAMSDTNAQNFRGMNELKKRAAAFLEVSKEAAGAEALAIAKEKNEQQEALIADMAKRLAALEGDTGEMEPVPDFEAPAPAPKATRRRKAT